LGGCPFAPGGHRYVVFEDLAFLCESKGFATWHRYRKTGRGKRSILKAEMPNEPLYGGLARADCGWQSRAGNRRFAS